MAKASFALLASALVVLAIAGSAHCHEPEVFKVHGEVYCDSCHVLFKNKMSYPLAHSGVELKCTNRDNGTVTLKLTNTTNLVGDYEFLATGEHEEDICEVTAISSIYPQCNETAPEINSARVVLSNNMGIQSDYRYVNPIGFKQDGWFRQAIAKECAEVLKEMGFEPLNDKNKDLLTSQEMSGV